MKTLSGLFAVILTLSVAPVWAQHQDHNHQHQAPSATETLAGISAGSCENVIDVKVNGLVCDFCARALEKVFSRQADVAGIEVNLDKGKVAVAMQAGKSISDTKLTKLITDSGYNVVTINKGC